MTDQRSTENERVSLRIRIRPWMLFVVLVSTLAMGATGYVLAERLAPSYVASVDLLVLPNERGVIDEALVRTFESVLRADAFATEIQGSAPDSAVTELTREQVAASITTSRSPTSSLIKVSVTRPDPDTALAIAEMLSPTVNELLTVGGADASTFYRQVFPAPDVREQSDLPADLAAAIGAFVGLLLGTLAVVLWTIRLPVVTTSEDIQELSGYPVIARLPAPAGWWRRARPNQFDPLAAAVQQVRGTGVLRGGVVAIVSPDENASISFTIAFSSLLAQASDRSVYLVDGDFRKASLSGSLAASQDVGWDRFEFCNESSGFRLAEKTLSSLSQVPQPEPETGDWPRPLLVPVGRCSAKDDRATTEQLGRVLHGLAEAGVAVVCCPAVPGDVPAAPAIIVASTVLIVARTGATSPADMELVGEMVASLSDAPAGVIVVEGGSSG